MNSSKDIEKGPFLGIRHLQTLMLLTNKIILGIIKSHINVTLVAMTNSDKSNPAFKEYNWTEQQKSYILSSLYLGCIITTVPGTYCMRRFGTKVNLLIITFFTGILNGLIPICVPWGGWQSFCLLRFLQGLLLACANSMMMQHLANWAPPLERNFLAGTISTGLEFGNIFSALLSGFLSMSTIGWPGVFYASTFLSLVWCFFWYIFGANNVTTSKLITESERAYVEISLAKKVEFHEKNLRVPWRSMFLSVPFWSLIVTRAAICFGGFTLQTELPAFINAVFGENIKKNAIYTTLPFVTSLIMAFVFMAIADFIAKKELLTLNASRKCFNSISLWIPAAALIWLGYAGKNEKWLAIALLMASVGFMKGTSYGSALTRVELAPNHTGIIVSIIDVTCSIVRMVGPLFVGAVVYEQQNHKQWRIVFNTTAVILALGDLVYCVLGTSETQIWNDPNFK